MLWQIITCDNSRHIIDAQKHLFDKYVPDAKIKYIDLKDEPIERWTLNVLEKLDTSEEYTILGLDDFLPIDHFPEIELPEEFDRVELGNKKGLYGKDDNYRVSCQFSIWRTEALVELLKTPRNPWQFEVDGDLPGNVYGVENPWRYINESAISKRRPGLINLCGLKKEDIDELVKKGYVEEDKIIYSWKGTAERTEESYGTKYARYF